VVSSLPVVPEDGLALLQGGNGRLATLATYVYYDDSGGWSTKGSG